MILTGIDKRFQSAKFVSAENGKAAELLVGAGARWRRQKVASLGKVLKFRFGVGKFRAGVGNGRKLPKAPEMGVRGRMRN